MLDRDLLSSIARQMMSGTAVEVKGKRVPVRRTSEHRLRTVAFEMGRQGIRRRLSRTQRSLAGGASLARKGHRVVQFKNGATNRFVAVAVDGKVSVYMDRDNALKLP